jgi:IS30 family transposase
MDDNFDRDDHRLRVLIERMQQEGHSERDIAAAVRTAARRIEREERRPDNRPNRLSVFGRRLITR